MKRKDDFMKDIFDIENTEDIPSEIKLTKSPSKYLEDRILELFSIANRYLSIDEVTVAYYRHFNNFKKKNKKQIMTKMYNMSRERNPKIESVKGKKGVYRITK